MNSINEKQRKLMESLKSLKNLAVAFSGGVDSAFLLKSAKMALNGNVLAVTARLRSTPSWEIGGARAFAEEHGVEQVVFDMDELTIDGFAGNPPDRCYICKRAVMGRAREIARGHGFKNLAEGSNTDDESDYRPGARAVAELGLLSPLKDAGLGKDEIRTLSRELGLRTWDKPAYACLASRFVYGERISEEKLRMVDAAESYLHGLGYADARVRVHGGLARIEVNVDEVAGFTQKNAAKEIDAFLKELGFTYVALDLSGYRRGSMNEVL